MEEVGPVCSSSDAYLTYLTTGTYTMYLKTSAYKTYSKTGAYNDVLEDRQDQRVRGLHDGGRDWRVYDVRNGGYEQKPRRRRDSHCSFR
ncbi:hypothetical protein JG688_00013891 [Phytophthora aleatoria]|uniref:Uncharacterized protein n=1 Tax=Phytophthora aleatoria TaxID=2496075 RepID=A0A8J5ICS4_9STRA|nr:hypothetical protein JG688_00013891 [Phytophthora aleatoria]